MTYSGVKFFRLFSGRLNSEGYLDILENCLQPTLDMLDYKENAIFQQDNAPCHSATIITNYLTENNIDRLEWPANSQDLNCIENLWSWLDKQLQKYTIRNVEQLKDILTNILNNVPVEICQKLVDSMPQRIIECYNAKGGQTRY